MKRIFIALLLAATAAVAQEKKAAAEPEYNSVREFKNKVFEIKNRDPRDVAQSVKLRYSHYGLMTAAVQRTKPGIMLRGSGVAEPTLLGMTPNQERPVFYDYTMTHITTTDTGVDIERFSFSMRVPIVIKAGGEISYQNVGFETPVSLRDKEKVVIGTTTMGDKALIVVVTATK